MAYITLDKTWNAITVAVNSFLYTAVENQNKQHLYLIKQAFVTAGWVVTQSSNSINVGSSSNLPADRWLTYANLINMNSGTAHSWVVLKNTAIGANFSVCLDYNSESYHQWVTVTICYGGYQAGTIQNRPVANIGCVEHVFLNNKFGADSSQQNGGVAILYSSDSECIRVFGSYAGDGKNATVNSGFTLLIEKLKNPASWLDYNYVAIVSGAAGGLATGFSYNNLCAAIPLYTRSEQDGVSIPVTIATLSITSTFGTSTFGSSFPDYGGRYMLTECYAMSASTSFPGIIGQFYDMYFTGSNIPEGMYMPTDTDVAGLVKLGHGVFGCSGNKVSIP